MTEEKEKYLEIAGTLLRYSACIDCLPTKVDSELCILIKSDANGRPYSTYNMQTDYSDFESIAFAVWARMPECKIVLRFDQEEWDNSFPLPYKKVESEEKKIKGVDSKETQLQYYMRFLYRAWKMSELYSDRFSISKDNDEVVKTFGTLYSEALLMKKLKYTVPGKESRITGDSNVSENHLEKFFVYKTEIHEIEKYVPELKDIVLHDQFPCGIFWGKSQKDVCKKNRIFNGGFFDLWGIDADKNICLYELKEKNNTSLGIISELFFYSCVCLDIREIDKCNTAKNYRGFQEFWSGKKGYIKAYFLAPKYYDYFEKNKDGIIREMNRRSDGKVTYSAISFNQDVIVGKDEKEFIKKLKENWTNR